MSRPGCSTSRRISGTAATSRYRRTAAYPGKCLCPKEVITGELGGGTGNPLAGQPGFGGYSFGWRREVVALPTIGDVRVRFEAGTDEGNDGEARYFAGWYLDNVALGDGKAPGCRCASGGRVARGPDRACGRQDMLPPLSVRVYDNTGIEAVISRYDITSRGGTTTGSMRLAMSGVDVGVYEGYLAPSQPFFPEIVSPIRFRYGISMATKRYTAPHS